MKFIFCEMFSIIFVSILIINIFCVHIFEARILETESKKESRVLPIKQNKDQDQNFGTIPINLRVAPLKAKHHYYHQFNENVSKIIKTTSGLVKGNTIHVLNKTIDEYIGIPYAAPPVGSLRFAKPKPISKPIEGVINENKVQRSCPQQTVMKKTYNISGDFNEDCLELNILSPRYEATNKLIPVMFWIYGGALSLGSIHQPWYNGSVLATHDVVFVAPNYRVGWFGFLYGGDETAPGNVGFFDQNLALQWVRDNIHLFGGDKNQITIFGQSAGSWGVSAHLMSPHSKGLFKRAILKAGAFIYNKDRPVYTKAEGLENAKKFAEILSCSGDDWLKCLQKLPTNKLITEQAIFYPVEETEFIPIRFNEAFEQGKFNKNIDLLAGIVKDEGTALTFLLTQDLFFTPLGVHLKDFHSIAKKIDEIFHNIDVDKVTSYYFNNCDVNNCTVVRSKIYDFVGDLVMKCPTYWFAKRYSQYSSPETNVFFYKLLHGAYVGRFGLDLGVHHGSDMELLFGHSLLFPNSTSAENIEFSKEYMKLFTDFVKYGKPDPQWPKLMGNHSLPAMDKIRNLHPNLKSNYDSGFWSTSCIDFWNDYFLFFYYLKILNKNSITVIFHFIL